MPSTWGSAYATRGRTLSVVQMPPLALRFTTGAGSLPGHVQKMIDIWHGLPRDTRMAVGILCQCHDCFFSMAAYRDSP